MTNTTLLKSVMVLRGFTIKSLARVVGMSTSSMSYKINNHRDFSISEVAAIKEAMNLSASERDEIFFATNLDK